MKIQINSLAALERLIGNDNELEIQIRNSVVQDFSKRHLKAIAQKAVDKDVLNIITEVTKCALQRYYENDPGWHSPRLENAFVEDVRKRVHQHLEGLISKTIRDVAANSINYDKMAELVNGAVGAKMYDAIIGIVNAKELSNKIKAALNESATIINKKE